jgi:HSP20 family protein
MLGLTRWTPFSPAFQLSRDFDELLGRILTVSPTATRTEDESTPTWLPAVETYARDGKLGVRVALPGVDPKDVEVSVMEDVLTIKGERKVESSAREAGYFRRELAYGTFERSLTLPEGVDAAQVRASYTNGMLEVTMPSPVAVAPKRVEIQIEGGQGEAKAIKAA